MVGLGKACEVAAEEMQSDKAHVTALAKRLYEGITSRLQGVVVNGPLDFSGHTRYPGNLNLSFAYVEGESLIMGLKVGSSNQNYMDFRLDDCRPCAKNLVFPPVFFSLESGRV